MSINVSRGNNGQVRFIRRISNNRKKNLHKTIHVSTRTVMKLDRLPREISPESNCLRVEVLEKNVHGALYDVGDGEMGRYGRRDVIRRY